MCCCVGIHHSRNTVVDRTVDGTAVSSVMLVRLAQSSLSLLSRSMAEKTLPVMISSELLKFAVRKILKYLAVYIEW